MAQIVILSMKDIKAPERGHKKKALLFSLRISYLTPAVPPAIKDSFQTGNNPLKNLRAIGEARADVTKVAMKVDVVFHAYVNLVLSISRICV